MSTGDAKEVIIAFVGLLAGAITGYFGFRGKKVEADSPIENEYIKEMRTIIEDYKQQKKELQEEISNLRELVDKVKKTNLLLENENQLLKQEKESLTGQIQKLEKKVSELQLKVNQLEGKREIDGIISH